MLSYLVAPNSFWAAPVHELLSQEPSARHHRAAGRSVGHPEDRRAAVRSDRRLTPEPVPKAQNEDPLTWQHAGAIQGGLRRRRKWQSSRARAVQALVTFPQPLVRGSILGNVRNFRSTSTRTTMITDGGGAEQSDVQFDSKGVDFGPWLRRFRAQVYRNWLIPQAAMVMRGHVSIRMAVHRNGTISGIQIVQSSGIEAFDTAAAAALKMSNPTLRLPDNYPGEVIDPFTVTFFYNERVK